MMIVVGLKSGVIKIYDIRNQTVIRQLEENKGHEVQNINFSNKGLQFSANFKGKEAAKLFNMRKMQEPALDVVHAYKGQSTSFTTFDYFGGYLMSGVG